MTKDTPIYKIVLVSLVCTIFASYPNMALMGCDWNCIPMEQHSCFISCTLIRFLLFWLFSIGILIFNQKMVKQHSLIGRILPNLLFTLLAFALYKYVTYLICPGFDRYGMIPTFQFIVMGTMGLLLGYTDYLSRMHQKKEAELHLLKIESLESRCTALTNQINPHFFFNSLSGISSLVRKKDERLTIDYIDHLSDIFRYILSSENKGLVTLEEELEFARSFCQVMQIRYAGKFDVCFDIPSEYMQMKIPVLALLPLIENVTVHNMIDSENRMQVRVYVNEEKSLVVENPIFVKQFKQETYGSGLQNLNKRFMLLANKQIDVSNDGKIFRITLPLIPY